MKASTGDSRQSLIEEGQRLVQSLVTRIQRSIPMRVDRDDLVAYGEIGLAEAARDFDPEQGASFTTFAYYRVRGAIYDGLSKMSWTSRAHYKRLKYQQMSNEVLRLDAETNRSSGSLEDEATWFRDVTQNLAVVYLASQSADEKGIRDSSIEDPRAASAAAIVAQQEIATKLHSLIRTLPRLEQNLIRMVYFEGATMQQAGQSLGISKSWASRLHAKSLEQLARELRRVGAWE